MKVIHYKDNQGRNDRKFKPEQASPVLRRRNFIKACRVLDVQGNYLVIEDNLDTSGKMRFLVTEPDSYEIGGCVDMVFSRIGDSSHKARLVGHTPPEFVLK